MTNTSSFTKAKLNKEIKDTQAQADDAFAQLEQLTKQAFGIGETANALMAQAKALATNDEGKKP
jgi:hypothetical protein